MRTIEEIQNAMRALLDSAEGRALTDEEAAQYEALEGEMTAVQRDNALRARFERSTSVTDVARTGGAPALVSGGKDSLDKAFNSYLRTGKVNADMEALRPSNAQTTGTGSSGGYLVPEGFRQKMVETMAIHSGFRLSAEQLTTETGNPLPYPTNNDTGNKAVVATENTAPASGADLAFGSVALGAFEYAASGASGNSLAVPRALLTDAGFDVEGFVARKLGERIGRAMGYDAVRGSGTGEAEGVLHGVTGIEISSVLAYGDLLKVIGDVSAGALNAAYWPNAKWSMNQKSLAAIMALTDAADGLIYKQQTMLSADGTTRIATTLTVGGVTAPVVIDNAFPDILLTAGAGQNWAVFGDFVAAYVWRMVQGIEVLADPYSANNKRQVLFDAWVRADGRIQDSAAYATLAGYTA